MQRVIIIGFNSLKRKHSIIIACICLLVIVLVGLSALWHQKSDFPIRHVVVRGIYWHVSEESLETVITPYAKRGYFFANLFSLQKKLKQDLPWIESATVTREWPDKIVVALSQKTAVAVLNKNRLISSCGDVFAPPVITFPPDLPNFIGPPQQAAEMLQRYGSFTSAANSASLSIIQLTLSPDGSWSVELSNKIVVILGDKDILTRFQRFIKIYQQVFVPQHREPSYVDMRYSHGMAVNWARS